MGIKLAGFDLFNEKLEAIENNGPETVNKFIAQEAETILGRVKGNTPTITGRLKNGWHRTAAANGKCQIYDNVDYAAHVEYGHRTRNGGFVKGQKMLHQGLTDTSKAFEADCAAIFKNLLGG